MDLKKERKATYAAACVLTLSFKDGVFFAFEIIQQ